MSDPLHEAGLDHPCKETCSGWKQGYDRGWDDAMAKVAESSPDFEKEKP